MRAHGLGPWKAAAQVSSLHTAVVVGIVIASYMYFLVLNLNFPFV